MLRSVMTMRWPAKSVEPLVRDSLRFVTCKTQVIEQFSGKVFIHFELHADRKGSNSHFDLERLQ